jgi:RNA polymerase sigma-70 factor (ECF subfamily)
LTTLDRQLLDRALQYDAQALAEVYDAYAEPIYHYLYRYVGDAAQAEDLTGEVFVKLLQVFGTPRAPRDNLRGWLYRVAHNLAMDSFRRSGQGEMVELGEELVAGGEQPPAAAERREAQFQLRRAIGKLTADQQRVILLRYAQGLKISEVSQIMGKSQGAVKIVQHRATKRLRKLLSKEGFAPEVEDG